MASGRAPLSGLPQNLSHLFLSFPWDLELNSSASDHSSTSPLGGFSWLSPRTWAPGSSKVPVQMTWVLMVEEDCSGIVTWALGEVGGPGAGWFFGMLMILPWWCLQAYQAYLPTPSKPITPCLETWSRHPISWRVISLDSPHGSVHYFKEPNTTCPYFAPNLLAS